MYLTSMLQGFYLIFKLQNIRKKLPINIAFLRNFNENRTKKILPYIFQKLILDINLRYISL